MEVKFLKVLFESVFKQVWSRCSPTIKKTYGFERGKDFTRDSRLKKCKVPTLVVRMIWLIVQVAH